MKRVANQKCLTYEELEEQIGVTVVLGIVRIPQATVRLLDRATTLTTREENRERRAVAGDRSAERHKSRGFQRRDSQIDSVIAHRVKHLVQDTRTLRYLTRFNYGAFQLKSSSMRFPSAPYDARHNRMFHRPLRPCH